jgi:hypothetical protein
MIHPAKTLLDLLQANYNLADEGIVKADITWTLQDWSKDDHGKYQPYVSVKMLGATRDQPVERNFKFSLVAQVIWWPQNLNETETKKVLVWKIVEKLRDIAETASLVPSGWQWIIVQRLADVSVLSGLPNVIIVQMTMLAEIYWSG